MNELFQARVTEGDIAAQLQQAEQLIDLNGTDYPDATYEEGVLDALKWIAGLAPAPLGTEED
jgi:hypothetical protein